MKSAAEVAMLAVGALKVGTVARRNRSSGGDTMPHAVLTAPFNIILHLKEGKKTKR